MPVARALRCGTTDRYVCCMGTIRESEYVGSIKSAEEMFALWRQVEVDIATVGQSYQVPGGVMVTMADIDKVRAQVRYWEGRVLAKRGATPGRNYADLSSAHSDNLGRVE